MKLERVSQMTFNEIVVRGAQEVSKWWDRMTAAPLPLTVFEREKPRTGGAHGRTGEDRHRTAVACLGDFRDRVSPRFFVGAADAGATARLIERIPDTRERVMSAANAICRGRFDLLGYRALDFGSPVDWHLDPTTGRRAPQVHWTLLQRPDPAIVGDVKVVWELNRHQWFLHLGQAYQFTGDERYAEAFARYVQEWLRVNPVDRGINWASSLEVAFRLISWCWTLALFAGSQALSADLSAEMRSCIEAHARHVERYLSYYFSPNTHLTGEALGLFYAGVLSQDLPCARRWRMLGAKILVAQSERHILPDGIYFEQSTYYQRYTAEIYLHFLILAARNGVGVPDIVAQRLERLLDALITLRRPDGSMPQTGDADGGWLLPVVPRAAGDLRGIFSVAAALFGRSDYAWAAGGMAPEVLWMLGPAGANGLESLKPDPPQTPPSRLFPHGGYAVMRNNWERGAHQLTFDVGPFGCPNSGAHGHADLLSIQCSAFGEPYLVDPGTYCYAVHPEWRNYFRSTTAHSTVRVDGQDQAVPAGPFKWEARPGARLRRWISTKEFDFAEGEHDAYHCLPHPVHHRRRVLFIKPKLWVIVDDLEGTATHRVELCFQVAPLEVTVERELWARVRGRGGRALLIRPFATAGLTATVYAGARAPIRGWISPNYGERMPAPLLVYATEARLPFRIVTLLLPLQDSSAPPPPVSLEAEEGVGPRGLLFADSGECIRLDPGTPVARRD